MGRCSSHLLERQKSYCKLLWARIAAGEGFTGFADDGILDLWAHSLKKPHTALVGVSAHCKGCKSYSDLMNLRYFKDLWRTPS